MSGDWSADVCAEPAETQAKKIRAERSATWEFTVTYLGSPGVYQWSIQAHAASDSDDDDDDED